MPDETFTTDLIDGHDSDTQAAIDAGAALVKPTQLAGGHVYTVAVPAGGSVVQIDLDTDDYRDHPRRKTGAVRVHDADSFVGYFLKHGLTRSEVYADYTNQALVGVINAGDEATGGDVEGVPGWGDHRVVLELRPSPAWTAWTRHNGQLLDQVAFAELIEARAIDIARPTSGEMLDLAQTFEATKGVDFKSSELLASGQRVFRFEEQTQAKAGQRGQLEIPKSFDLALSPFDGGITYRVLARLRYRITSGGLQLGYVLERPEDALREAFTSLVEIVEAGVTQPLYRGRPA